MRVTPGLVGKRMAWPLAMNRSSQPSRSTSMKPGAPADVLLAHDGQAGRGGLEEERHHAAGSDVVAIQAVLLVLVVGHPQRRLAAAVVVARVQSHAAVGSAAIVAGRAAGQAYFLEADLAGRRVVHVEKLVHGVVGHVHVGLAVAVEIDHQHAQPLAGVRSSLVQPGLGADVHERTFARIAINLVRQAVKAERRTDVGSLAVVGTRGVFLPRPIDILADVEVRPAVAVEIAEGGAGRPGDALVQPRLRGHVLESPCRSIDCGTARPAPSRSPASQAGRRGRSRRRRHRACRTTASRPPACPDRPRTVTSLNLPPPRLRKSLHGEPTMSFLSLPV